MKILVSACLLGLPCRYDAKRVPSPRVMSLAFRHTLIPVCPEQMGGLPTPRIPCERQQDRVIARDGSDKTDAYRQGAMCALDLYRLCACSCAVLKSRSPSCGTGCIYDGTFSGVLTEGNGTAAELLMREGIPVYSEESPELEEF